METKYFDLEMTIRTIGMVQMTNFNEKDYNDMNFTGLDFKERAKGAYILTDGAMGTYYNRKYAHESGAPELANIQMSERIVEIHREYLAAGAKLIRTNSFASNVQTLTGAPLRMYDDWKAPLKQVYDNVKAAYDNAVQAVAGAQSDACAWIAGDIGPVPQQGMVSDFELRAQYETMADALLDAGAKIILFETFSDFAQILDTVRYIKAKADPVIMASFCLNKFGYTKSGLSASAVIETASKSGLIDVVGFNCGIGSAHMEGVLKSLDLGEMLVSVSPNSGYPEGYLNRQMYQENIGYFCDHMKTIAGLGVNIVGGCCGTTPEYVKMMAQMLKNMQLQENPRAVKKIIFERRIHHSVKNDEGELCLTKNDLLNKLESGRKAVVVELDPPYNGNDEKILQATALLKDVGVDVMTFSDSPMGKMRADSILSAVRVHNQLDIAVMPHIACRDKNTIAMGASLMGAHMNGVRNALIVTGDPVQAGDRNSTSSVYDFNSIRLMNYLTQLNCQHFADDPIIFGGALNYGRKNIDKEIDRMRQKKDAGASYFLTQPIYSDEDIERIRYIKTQIDTKILCGIMPLVSYKNARFIQNEIYGIHVPEETVNRYTPEMSRDEAEQVGVEIAVELMERLQPVADGYYFMVPFNRASMICKIIEKGRQFL